MGKYQYTVDCICGWSSALYANMKAANDAYAKHKMEAASVLKSTEGTEL